MTTTEIPTVRWGETRGIRRQAVTDMAAIISGLLLHIGDRLGLYKAMAGAGPITSAELARRTGTTERYFREWLGNQAAGGYVIYHPAECTYELPAEQAMVLADEDSPVFLAAYYGLSTMICTPVSLAQEVGLGLGVQAGERQLAGVLREAGFGHVRRATETPFNIISSPGIGAAPSAATWPGLTSTVNDEHGL